MSGLLVLVVVGSLSPQQALAGFSSPAVVTIASLLVGKSLVFLTNLFAPSAVTICALYKARWQVELFFKWIKQHLRIKKLFGTLENAVKAQIWTAVSVYLLVTIVKKRLNPDVSRYTLLLILSVAMFEKFPLNKDFSTCNTHSWMACFLTKVESV